MRHDLGLLIDRANPVCLDVGANVGQTIMLLVDNLKDPEIHAFEPSTKTFNTLQTKFKSDRIILYKYGVGSEKGVLDFNNLPNSQLSSFLIPQHFPWSKANRDYESTVEQVQVITLDQFIQEHNMNHVDLLKSDTQGYDLQVLKGAERSLLNGVIKFVLVEINQIEMYENQGTRTDIFRFLEKCGFYIIDNYDKVRHPSDNGTISWNTSLFGRRDNNSVVKYLKPF